MGSGHVVYSQKNRQEGKANHAENPKIFAPAVSLCDPRSRALDVICLYAGHKRAEKDRQEALKTAGDGDSSAKPSSAPYVPPGPDSRTDSMEERQKTA